MLVTEDIKKHGGIPIIERSGHSIIEAKIKEQHALLAGEMSGHIFFADKWYGFDDGIYSAFRILEIYTSERNMGNNIFEDIPEGYNTPEIRIDCKNGPEVLDLIEKELKNKGIPFVTKDGVRVEYDNGWWLIRASNTQEQITLRVEGKSLSDLENLKKEVEEFLIFSGIKYKFPS
jgi:phosphomannomutase/phosphoglucomutase